MDKIPANIVDLIVVALIVLSAVLAVSRGFTREILSIVGWIAAIFATLYGFPIARPYAREVIAYDILADAIAGIGIFVVTLASISLISGMISQRLRESSLGALDRSLGVLFGLLRGVIFVCLGFLCIQWIYQEEYPPDWLHEARFSPVLETGGKLLLSLAPKHVIINPINQPTATRPEKSKNPRNFGNSGNLSDRESIQKEVDQLSSPQPQPGQTAEETGYSRQERREMDRLHHSLENN